jgi:hypothetical protein
VDTESRRMIAVKPDCAGASSPSHRCKGGASVALPEDCDRDAGRKGGEVGRVTLRSTGRNLSPEYPQGPHGLAGSVLPAPCLLHKFDGFAVIIPLRVVQVFNSFHEVSYDA